VLVMHPAEKPYVGVDMIQYLLPSLVPRIIWPAKPSERWPMYFATTTYMAARTEYTFTALGLVADCYRAAGWPFVVTFFMLFGVLGARLYQAGPGSNKFAGTVFYVFMITWVLVLETELISIIIRLLTFAPLILLCIRFLLFHRPASAPPQLIHDPYKISEP
jgi:hypothetical protein